MELTKTQIEASSLSISIFAKQKTYFIAQLGIKLEENVDLKKDETWEKNTEGGFRFETDEVNVLVTPGELDFESLRTKYEKLKSDYQNVLDEYNVKSYEELRVAYNKYKSLLNDFQNAENNYKQELGEDSYEEIAKKAKNLNSNKNNAEVRLLEPIIVDITKKESNLQQYQNEKESLEEELNKFIDEYETKDNIFLRLGEESKLTKDLESEIKLLKNIPQDYSNADEFINAYEQKVTERDEIKDELNDKLIAKSGLEPQLSDISSTELNEIIFKKKEEFNRHIKTGLALKTIIDKTNQLKESIDKNIYDSYQEDLLTHIAELSGDKYRKAIIEESIPKALIDISGKEISNELLSAGTKDILGLSVHLAMVKYYLEGKAGFVGIDDPLVDLDPIRQKAASSLLINFAKEKQAIIFTCHPVHADQLKGNRIEI
ncbi:MAG: hypothetical protein KDC52_08820 [Ignavibacteriae bacterium]|nr:hypothetical protein [Ignavibacteriota bacterium]